MDQEPGRKIRRRNKRNFSISHSVYFEGPLPHPSILDKYEQITPGSADRIITMTEIQSKHRQELEKKVTQANIWSEKIGMALAFIITMSFVTGGFILILEDKQVSGFLTIISTLSLHIYNFYKQSNKQESDKKPDN